MEILKNDGWYLVRTKGSHYIFQHSAKKGSIPIPMHGNEIIKPGTANNILKLAGLNKFRSQKKGY